MKRAEAEQLVKDNGGENFSKFLKKKRIELRFNS